MASEDKTWHQDIPNHQSKLNPSYTNTAPPAWNPTHSVGVIQQPKQCQGGKTSASQGGPVRFHHRLSPCIGSRGHLALPSGTIDKRATTQGGEVSRGRVGLCHYFPSVSVVQRDAKTSFLTQRQAEPLEKTTAGRGGTQKPPVPRPPQPEAMPPLPTPSRTRSLSASPPSGTASRGPSPSARGVRKSSPAGARGLARHKVAELLEVESTSGDHLVSAPAPPPLFSARRAELSRPIVPRTPRRRQRTHHAGRASCSAHRPPQLRHTGAATEPCCCCSSSSTRGPRGSAAIARRRPAATPAAAILCVDCSSHRPPPSLSAPPAPSCARLPPQPGRDGTERDGEK